MSLRRTGFFAFVLVATAASSSPLLAATIHLLAGAAPSSLRSMQERFVEPFGLVKDSKGTLFGVEMTGGRLFSIDPSGAVWFLDLKFDGKEPFKGPHTLAILPNDDILVADTWSGRIRRVGADSRVVKEVPGFSVPLDQARASGPYCITLDTTGTGFFVADLRRIHHVDLRSGKSRVIAGNGEKGRPVDGALAVESPLVDPRAVAPDALGNVYILERNGHALRVVDAKGRIRTVVNASGQKGISNEDQLALEAHLNGPKFLAVDVDNSVLIADAENNLICRYLPVEGRLVRVAGTGKAGAGGLGGDPLRCELKRPHGLLVGEKGRVYVVDSYNDRILAIDR